MKKVLTAILAVVALLACNNEHTPKGVRYPIVFSNADTRAVADLSTLQEEGFMVYAFVKGNVGSTSFAKNVEYTTQNVWAFESPEYWIPNTDYYFKAFYPPTLTSGTLAVDNSSSDQSYTITNFDITYQEDVMVASATATVPIGASHPDNSSVVGLNFEHLLANVVVKIKAEVNVTINNISLKYVPVNGSYADGSWSYSSQGNIVKDGLNKSLSSSSNEYHDVTDGGFLAFPSSVSGTSLFIRTSDKTYELPLQAPTSWVAGNRYTYTLTIKQNDILFDEPTVEEWDEENATGSVVIK